MRSHHQVALGLSLLAVLGLPGCDKNEASQIARAKADVASADLSAARIELKNAIQTHPKSGEARYLFGDLLLNEGDAAAAAIELQRALEFGHPETLVLPRLAEALLLSGQAARVDAYADAQLSDPSAQARLLAAVAQGVAVQGDLQRAKHVVAKALASDPKSPQALLMKARLAAISNDVDAGLATLDTLLASHAASHEAWALKGDLLLRKPDGQLKAIEAFSNALKAKPDQVYSHTALISLYLARSDLVAARKQLALLQKLAPKNPNTAWVDAHLAYASGYHARARSIYQSLLRGLPENINLLLATGENEIKLGAPLQAEALFAKALALAPRNPLARRMLAEVQIRLGQAPRAQVTLAPLVDAPDASADVLALAAQARLINGEAKAADALYTRMAKLKPADPRLRTIIANAGFGKRSDDLVLSELHDIASSDAGTSADMALISAHLRRDQFDGALRALDALGRKRPSDPMVALLRGQVLVAKRDTAGARRSLEEALKLNAGYFPAVAALAALDMKEGKPDLARQRIKDLLKAQPKNATAMLALAELMARQGAPRADVLKQIEAATKAVPTDLDARIALISHHFSRNNFDAALDAAQAATTALPESIELLELLGRCQLRVHQTSQALTTYGKIVNLQPRSPRGHVGMADIYLASNELELAQRSINRALELAPGLPEAQGQAVLIALRKQDPARALEIARQMQAERPGDATGFLVEGDLEMRRGNWAAAVPPLRKATERDSPAAAPIKLHQALLRSSKPGEADAFAAQWLKGHPADGGFLFYLGDTAQSRGDVSAAEKHYTAVLAIDADQVLALNNLAMLRIQQKKPGARELAEHAVQLASDQPAFLDTLAQAHASENSLGKAIEIQQRAVVLAPDTGEFRLNLARLLIQAGDKKLARAEVDKLMSLGTGFPMHAEVAKLSDALGQTLR